MAKTIKCNISGKIFRVVYNMYKSAKSFVAINGFIDWKFSMSHQGSTGWKPVSSFIFTLFKWFATVFARSAHGFKRNTRQTFDNNLCAVLKLYILLYADDTVLLAESPKNLSIWWRNTVIRPDDSWCLFIELSCVSIESAANVRTIGIVYKGYISYLYNDLVTILTQSTHVSHSCPCSAWSIQYIITPVQWSTSGYVWQKSHWWTTMQRHEEGGNWEIGFATDGPPLVHHRHNNVAMTFVWWATTGNRWHSVVGHRCRWPTITLLSGKLLLVDHLLAALL